jgi:protoporphyrinogen oxidase
MPRAPCWHPSILKPPHYFPQTPAPLSSPPFAGGQNPLRASIFPQASASWFRQASLLGPGPSLLAATFVDQKFPHRAPAGARILRAFFGTGSAERFANTPDAQVAQTAIDPLRTCIGPLPDPAADLTTIRRWPRSLPLYEVGHLDRMTELDTRIAAPGNLTLLGNAYRGVGLPDLIKNARESVRRLAF